MYEKVLSFMAYVLSLTSPVSGGFTWSLVACLLISLRFVFLLYLSLFLIELLVSEMGGLTSVAYTELLIFFCLRCKGPARFFIG